MPTRVTFAAICLFFVTMNVLLWRSEFAGQDRGSELPVGVVWEKILSAPDDSNLEIMHKGQKLGSFRWSASAGETAATGKAQKLEELPDGQIRKISGYTVEIADGMLFMDDKARRLRFRLEAKFSAEHLWREVTITAIHKPTIVEISATSAEEALRFKVRDDGEIIDRKFTFAELREPEKMLQSLGDSMQVRLLAAALGGSLGFTPGKNFTLGLKWEARNDTLQLGNSRLRIYRLSARLLDRYQIVVIVSRVGEILRVELPDDLRFTNVEFGFKTP